MTQTEVVFSVSFFQRVNCLPSYKILDMSNLKGFADDKINETRKLNLILGRIKNIAGKGENAGYQDFLQLQQCFQKAGFSLRVLKRSGFLLTLSQISPGVYVSAVQVF